MKKDAFVRLSGWLLIVGAIVFLPGVIAMMLYDTPYADAISLDSQVAILAIFLSPILLAVGLMGLRTRYGIGSGVLLFGTISGGLLVIVGTLGQFLAPVYSVSETYYGVWFGGAYILFASLTIFGIMALTQKPLPRWNALPLISGLWFTFLPLLFGIGSVSVNAFLIISIAGFIVMAVAQIMLGYILQADVSQRTATA